jgi:hypothetical protein
MSRHLFVLVHGYWGSEDSQAHGGVPEGTGPGGAVPLLARGGTGAGSDEVRKNGCICNR